MTDATTARFDIHAIAAAFPAVAETMLIDTYLVQRPAASARVFRVYAATPPHYHAGCDEYLYVVSGRGTFWLGHAGTKAPFGPGELLFFARGVIHALPDLIEEPVVFMSIDTPARDPRDIVFVDPAAGSPETFIGHQILPAPDCETDAGAAAPLSCG